MNNTSQNIDLNKFQKIEDIIFYDEPILTHLKNNSKDYLMYLVDTLNDKDVFLIYEVAENDLFKYLTKNLSLLDLFSTNENPIIKISQDFYGTTVESEVLFFDQVTEDYLPDTNSYLEFNPSENSYYNNFIEEYNSKLYLENLRKEAFYVKFSTNSEKYAETIGLIELSNDFLLKISSSFKSFLKADFAVNFKEEFSDALHLKRVIKKLEESLDYRIVDLNFGSFEMGLAVDTVMKNGINDKNIKNWAEQVGHEYKNTVLENNFNEEELESISQKYTEEERIKIFKPIHDISKNSEYNLEIKDNKKEKYSKVRIKNKKSLDILIPPKRIYKKELDKDLQIVQITTVVDKNNTKKSIKIVDDLLSTADTFEYTINNSNFSKIGLNLNEEISIKVEITTIEGSLILSCVINEEPIKKLYRSEDLEEVINDYTKHIASYI